MLKTCYSFPQGKQARTKKSFLLFFSKKLGSCAFLQKTLDFFYNHSKIKMIVGSAVLPDLYDAKGCRSKNRSEDIMFQIRLERPEDRNSIETLLDKVLGHGRHDTAMALLRRGASPFYEYSFVVRRDRQLVATIRYWPVALPQKKLRLAFLGPVAVDPSCQCEGIGAWLIRHSLKAVQDDGLDAVLVVGHENYFDRFGFSATDAAQLSIKGLIPEGQELLAYIITPHQQDHLSGLLQKYGAGNTQEDLQANGHYQSSFA
jgi:predicted N-acetyltransferase YhbS